MYVAHLSSLAALSADAIAEVEKDFDEIEQELRGQAAGQLDVSGAAWEFERRQGSIADQLIAAATVIAETHPDENVAIMVGSSSHATPPRGWFGRGRLGPPLAGAAHHRAVAAAEPADAGSGPGQGLCPCRGRGLGAGQAMKGMSWAGVVTKGRIMSRSSCSRMWQWYMYRPL